MQDDGDRFRKTPDDDESPQPSSSYVYPVKSLLTGIKPAPPTQSQRPVPRRNSNQAGDIAVLQNLLTNQLAGTRKKSTAGLDMVSSRPMSSRPHPTPHSYPSRTAIAGPSDVSEEHPRIASDPFSPRIQPIDGQSSLPISFMEAGLSPASTQPSVSRPTGPLAPPELDLSVPGSSPSDTSPVPPQPPGDKVLTSFESKSLQDTTEYTMNEKRRASPTHSDDSHISHISRSGIVHLPPLSSASGSSRAASRGSGSHTNSQSRYISSNNSKVSSQRMHQVPEVQEEAKVDDSSSPPSSDQKSVELKMDGEPGAAGDFSTTGYRHETDENGNHVVIGQEGEIRRCEDEVRIS